MISISGFYGFYDFLKNDYGEFELRDNPKFTSRNRNINSAVKSRWSAALEAVAVKTVTENPEKGDEYLDIIADINFRVQNASRDSLLYEDRILGYQFLRSTIIDKLGYVTYYKEHMAWYDLSDRLVDLLSIATGTNPNIIECLLNAHLKHNYNNMSIKEFSRKLLGDEETPRGYASGLINSICPTVTNLLKGLLTLGMENNYTIRGRQNIARLISEMNSDSAMINLDDIMDIYLCNCLRLLCYYILGNVYLKIVALRNTWLADSGKEQMSELLTAWSHTELIFQNVQNRVFPTIEIKGRNNIIMTLEPAMHTLTSALEAGVKGELYL